MQPQPSESITAVWRAALDQIELLDALDPEARERALDDLARTAPQLRAAVDALRRDPIDEGDADDDGALPGAQALAAAARNFAPADLNGRDIGAYRFVRPIGAGGMGQVWLAERIDGRFEGQVAVKLLDWSSSPALVERFKREGQVLARLAHPNIARLLDAGAMPSGQLYLVLEYVDGQRLDAHADAQRATVAQRLALFLDVCAAVSLAHANLVVHRDLKPSNILVATDGTVKLLDFGIAKLLQAEDAASDATELTRAAGQAMTLEYAAPEQVAGGAVTTATDVYALGVVLTRLLTGASPYRTVATRAELAHAVMHDAPLALSAQTLDGYVAHARSTTPERLRDALRGDLDTIVHKALKKAPAERYATVQALADDVRRHLAHEPVQARPDTLGYRARKFVRRNRVQVGALAAVFASLVAGIGATAWQWREAAREAQRTRSVVQVLTDVFTDVHPNRTGSARVPMTELLERGWQRAQRDLAHDPQLHGEVARALGLLMHESGDSDATVEALQAARDHLARTGRQLGREYVEVATALASVWSARGEHEKALPLIDDAIETTRASGLVDSSDAVLAQTVRGGVLRSLGRLDEARVQLETAAETAARVHGPRHEARARALTELADIARQQGRWQDARALFTQTLDATAEDDRQAAAMVRFHGAVLDVDLGLYVDAVDQLRPLAASMTELMGADATQTLTARSWLAVALSHSGRHEEAARELEQLLQRIQSGHGDPGQADTLKLTQARLQLRRGRADLAEPAARAALQHYEAVAPNVVAALRARAIVGDTMMRRQAYGEAAAMLAAALPEERDVARVSVHQRLHAMLRHAVAVDLHRGPIEALPLYTATATLARERLTAGHPERLRAEVLESHARWRTESTPPNHDRVRTRLAAFGKTQAVRSDPSAFSVYQDRLMANTEAPAAKPADLFAMLDF